MITISEIMTKDVKTLAVGDSVFDARTLMHDAGIRHIPVTDENGSVVGVFSQRDLLTVMDANEKDLMRQATAESGILLGEVMSKVISTANSEVSLREAALYLQDKKYGCLPIVDQGELKGIVTDSDFVAVAINLLEQLELSEPLDSDELI